MYRPQTVHTVCPQTMPLQTPQNATTRTLCTCGGNTGGNTGDPNGGND